MSESVASVLSAILLLVYWEVRARAARSRQEALQEEVRDVPRRTAELVPSEPPTLPFDDPKDHR